MYEYFSSSADLIADPIAISGGEQSTLYWNQAGGALVAGMISNDAADALVQASYARVMATPLLGGLAGAGLGPRATFVLGGLACVLTGLVIAVLVALDSRQMGKDLAEEALSH